jgi:hypothetical protein
VVAFADLHGHFAGVGCAPCGVGTALAPAIAVIRNEFDSVGFHRRNQRFGLALWLNDDTNGTRIHHALIANTLTNPCFLCALGAHRGESVFKLRLLSLEAD